MYLPADRCYSNFCKMGISTDFERSIFDRFLSIESGSFREIVHFYEDYRDRIYSLDIQRRFEIHVCYIEALFEMGKYKEVLFNIDDAIETAIVFDYSTLFGADIYFNLLLKKAVALHHLHKTDEALAVTKQLLSMSPDEPNVRFFFKEIMLFKCRKLVLPTRVFFISGLITTTVLMAFELLVVWPFYNEIGESVTHIRNLLFLFSVLMFISGEASRFLLMQWQAIIHIRGLKRQKSQKDQPRKEKITIKHHR